MAEKEAPKRGLPAIHEAREQRATRMVPPGAGKFWIWCGIAIVAICVFYWKKTETENEAYRTRILSKQREIDKTLGPTYFPLRDRIEGFTMEVAKADLAKDVTAPDAKSVAAELLAKPGVYLRLAAPDATSAEKIRAAAVDSLKDAFTACFSRAKNPDPYDGKECRSTKECDPGKLCNEVNHCTALAQPANLRVAYRGMRVLSDQWVRDVQTATDQLRLRLYESDLDDANASDIPASIELMKRAQYFLVVLDEIPPGTNVPEGRTLGEVVQAEVHPTRVGFLDLRSGKPVMEARRTIDVAVPMVPGNIEAQQRQVLNCALAMDVRSTLGATE